MDEREVASLVERSEAAAYASLVTAPAPELREALGLFSRSCGSTVSVVAQSVTNSLNMNRIIGLGVDEPASEALLDELSQPYVERALSFAIELSPRAAPQSLGDWLRTRRMRKVTPTLMHWRAAAVLDPGGSALRVERAREADAATVADICCEVFRMPAPAHAMISATARLPQWRQWLAYDESGAPVAAALSFVQDGIAWLGWDATLPQSRGKGAQSALIARRVNDAVEAGCRFVTSETAINTATVENPSSKNYRRAGFMQAYERGTYVALRKPLVR